MASQEVEKVPRKGRPSRSPEQGNILWKLYKELGHTARKAFWEHMGLVSISQTTFSKHSMPERRLGQLFTEHYNAYRQFFLHHGGHDIQQELDTEQALPLFTSPPAQS